MELCVDTSLSMSFRLGEGEGEREREFVCVFEGIDATIVYANMLLISFECQPVYTLMCANTYSFISVTR